MENLNQQPNQTSELNQDSTAGPSEEKNRLMFWVTVLVIIFLVVVIGAVVWLIAAVGLTEKEETLMSNPGVIEGEHLIEDNRHVISGQIMVPNSCYNIDAEVKKDGGSSEKVRLDFYGRKMVDEDGECLDMEGTEKFEAQFIAPTNVEIEATFNGEPVELQLIRNIKRLMRAPEMIEAKHIFKNDNTHVIAGEIVMPNSCYHTSVTVHEEKTTSDEVVLDFWGGKKIRWDEECMAVEIPDSFRVEFTASPEVETRALFNDEPVELELVHITETDSEPKLQLESVGYGYYLERFLWNDQRLVRYDPQTSDKEVVIDSVADTLAELSDFSQSELDTSLNLNKYVAPDGHNLIIFRSIVPGSDSPPKGLYSFNIETKELKRMAVNRVFDRGLVDISELLSPEQDQLIWIKPGTVKTDNGDLIEGMSQELYVIDLINDSYRRAVTLSGNYTFNSGLQFGEMLRVWHYDISWLDNNTIKYAVYDYTKRPEQQPQQVYDDQPATKSLFLESVLVEYRTASLSEFK